MAEPMSRAKVIDRLLDAGLRDVAFTLRNRSERNWCVFAPVALDELIAIVTEAEFIVTETNGGSWPVLDPWVRFDTPDDPTPDHG